MTASSAPAAMPSVEEPSLSDRLLAAADAMEQARDEARVDFKLFWTDNEMAAARVLIRVAVAGLRAAAIRAQGE